jgi:hypothetical protein
MDDETGLTLEEEHTENNAGAESNASLYDSIADAQVSLQSHQRREREDQLV